MAKLHVRHMVGGRAPDVRARAALPLRVSRAARRADALPRRAAPDAGTSACSTTATTARISAACWRGSKSKTTTCRRSDRFSKALATSTQSNPITPPIVSFSDNSQRPTSDFQDSTLLRRHAPSKLGVDSLESRKLGVRSFGMPQNGATVFRFRNTALNSLSPQRLSGACPAPARPHMLL